MSEESKKPAKKAAKKTRKPRASAKKTSTASSETEPLMTFESFAYDTTQTRRNKSAVVKRTDRFKNIDDGLVPYSYYSTPYSTGAGNSDIDIRDAVTLYQKAYYNFAQFRNVIDLMTELSIGTLYLEGENKKSKKFFEEFFEKMDLFSLQDRFYREYFRSGNIFLYRFEGKLADGDLKKVANAYGANLSLLTEGRLPTRYVFLNPADIRMTGTASFYKARYSKVLSPYEIQRIKNPLTEEDHTIRESLDKETLKKIDSGNSKKVSFPLDSDRLVSVFYKKQDYEPFAVPMGFPVLADLSFKDELKKMDMAIARTMQQAILLVTMGTDPDKGGVNQKNLMSMQKLFENQSVGRVLIADYTTKAEFVIPQIGQLLDSKKYEVIDRDINIGLNNIFIGGEKFANQTAKVEVFISRLAQGRRAFVNHFLLPEIKRISKSLGFRSFPTPYFEDFELKTSSETLRVYTRLMELGILTPEEGIKALETNRLPNKEESLEAQEEYKEFRDKGYYEPIAGGPHTQEELADKTSDTQLQITDKNIKSQQKLKKDTNPKEPSGNITPNTPNKVTKESGRPSGTKNSPYKSNRKMTPIGGEDGYSMSKIKEGYVLAQDLEVEVSRILREKHNVKRLTKAQKEVASDTGI